MHAKTVKRLFVACATALAGITGTANGAVAATGHDRNVVATGKWQTDEALQRGMLKIREIVERNLPAIRAGDFRYRQYSDLGKRVEAQVAYIASHCKLEPEADAVLHGLMAELWDGVDAVAGRMDVGGRSKGAERIVSALDHYGQHFDQPGWMSLESGL